MQKPPLKSFRDTKEASPLPLPKGKIAGDPVVFQFKSIKIGAGATVFVGDISGIWLGARTFATAPFSVDMAGNVRAASVTITGGTIAGVSITGYLPIAGGTMTGALILASDPVVALGAATKQYVDASRGQLSNVVGNNDEIILHNDEVVYT